MVTICAGCHPQIARQSCGSCCAGPITASSTSSTRKATVTRCTRLPGNSGWRASSRSGRQRPTNPDCAKAGSRRRIRSRRRTCGLWTGHSERGSFSVGESTSPNRPCAKFPWLPRHALSAHAPQLPWRGRAYCFGSRSTL